MNNFLRLILIGLTNIVPDYIDKYSTFSKAMLEKGLEFFSHNRYNSSTPNLPFISLLVI